jgi:metal-responsive CopG/Arc/MetJ family transcriptional regulator
VPKAPQAMNTKTKSITVRIPLELYKSMDKIVDNYGSKSELVILAIREYIENAQKYIK